MAPRKKRTSNAAAGAGVGAGEAVSPQALEVVRANPDMTSLTTTLKPIAPQLVAAVASVQITDTHTAAVMGDLARQIKTIIGIIDEKFEPLEAGVKQTTKAIRALKSEIATPFEGALETAKDKLGAWELRVLEAQRARDRENAQREEAEREAARVFALPGMPGVARALAGTVFANPVIPGADTRPASMSYMPPMPYAPAPGQIYPYQVEAKPMWDLPQALPSPQPMVVDANQGARDFGVKLDGVTTVVSWDATVTDAGLAVRTLANCGGDEFLMVDVAALKRAVNDKERGPGVRAALARISGISVQEVASVRTRGY